MNQVGRPCSVCTHPHRALIEAEVVGNGGQAVPHVSTVANRFGVGPHSLRRHLQNHAAPGARGVLGPREGADPAMVLERALAVADAVRTVRLQAERSGDHREVLRAGESELKALTVLSVRLGMDAESTVQALAEAKVLARAVGDVARVDPEVGEAIASRLELRGSAEMAEALRAGLPNVSENKEEQGRRM